MTKKIFIATLAASTLIFGSASAMKSVTIVDQGSFFAGGQRDVASSWYAFNRSISSGYRQP